MQLQASTVDASLLSTCGGKSTLGCASSQPDDHFVKLVPRGLTHWHLNSDQTFVYGWRPHAMQPWHVGDKTDDTEFMTITRPPLNFQSFTVQKPRAMSAPSPDAPNSRSRRLALYSVLAIPGIVKAQVRVEVEGIGANKIAVAIAAFKGETVLQRPITAVAMMDLERTGQFKGKPIAEGVLDDTVRIDTSPWRTQGWDAVVCGSVKRLPDGKLRLGVRIWGTVGSKDLGGQSLTVDPVDVRLAAHRIADFVYTTLTGVRGVFATRIAYVTKASGRFNIQVADADGAGSQSALTSNEPIISPTWSPDGKHIAYVSFESRKPLVYIHELKTGVPKVLACTPSVILCEATYALTLLLILPLRVAPLSAMAGYSLAFGTFSPRCITLQVEPYSFLFNQDNKCSEKTTNVSRACKSCRCAHKFDLAIANGIRT